MGTIFSPSSSQSSKQWMPIATTVVCTNRRIQSAIPSVANTPILGHILRTDGSIKGGNVGGTEVTGSSSVNNKEPKESYLCPHYKRLQALPCKVEFTYLSSNEQCQQS